MTNPNATSLNQDPGLRLQDLSGLIAGTINFNALSLVSATSASGKSAGTQSLFWESAQDNITANAGGGSTNAVQLYNEINRITTVATSGDSVLLMPATPGLTVMVINHGANPMQVYGQQTNATTGTGDTIDDVASATGASQMQGSVVFYTCATAGKWYSEGLATGYSGQLQTLLTIDGITAASGGTQSTGTQLTGMINRVTTSATSGASVLLPKSAVGLSIVLINDGASLITTFGFAAGDLIDGSTSGAPLGALKRAQFWCTTAGTWASVAGSKSA